MKIDFDIQNITDNDGLAISLVGMSIVFTGLVLVSLYIIYMPKMLLLWDRMIGKGPPTESDIEAAMQVDESELEESSAREQEIMAAITTVVEMALNDDDGTFMQRITIRRSRTESIWRQAGQMRSLSSNLKQ